MFKKKSLLFCVTAFCLICNDVQSQQHISRDESEKLLYTDLVNKFYELNKQQLFWYAQTTPQEIRNLFLEIINSSEYYGLEKEKYRFSQLKDGQLAKDPLELTRLDRLFTDMVIAFCKDVYQGYNIKNWIKNDEISGRYTVADNDYLLNNIVSIASPQDVNEMIRSIEPKDPEYAVLKSELKKQIEAGNTSKSKKLATSINLYRWIHHFHFDKFIVVNIPSATLRYYEKDNLRLQMNIVAGKPSTRSPRFATWCDQVVLYPYWNVPRSIAVKELLPQFRKDPASVDNMDMQVIDKNGKVIDHHGIDWNKYSQSNFPFSLRQCTGCDNALGVIKFNLTDPFSVYMHDTNYKIAFLSKKRFFSHGCIRVEKPIELGNYLLNTIDSAYLKACLKDQKPLPVNIEPPVPVFVVYMTAEVAADTVAFHKDIYRQFNKKL